MCCVKREKKVGGQGKKRKGKREGKMGKERGEEGMDVGKLGEGGICKPLFDMWGTRQEACCCWGRRNGGCLKLKNVKGGRGGRQR